MSMKFVSFILFTSLALGSVAACDRQNNREPQPKSQTPSQGDKAPSTKDAPPLSAAKVLEPEGEFRLAAAERVVGIGDLHGDFSATKKAFQLAGAIDEAGTWSGGKLVVVQTGDQLDRGAEEREIIEFLERLQKEAEEAGGKLVVLNGNHEAMNVMGDFRYLAAGAMNSFDDYEPASPLSIQIDGPWKSRAAAFLPGGGAAQVLARRPLVVMVGETVFVHGGLMVEHLSYGIDRLNREAQEWMLGKTTMPPPPVVQENGPLWTRIYGAPQLSESACKELEKTLAHLGAKRMAVGHTVQPGGMSGACNDQVFRIDVGLAAAYGSRPVQVLEIKKDAARILTAP